MKKLIVISLTLALLLGLCACGSTPAGTQQPDAPPVQQQEPAVEPEDPPAPPVEEEEPGVPEEGQESGSQEEPPASEPAPQQPEKEDAPQPPAEPEDPPTPPAEPEPTEPEPDAGTPPPEEPPADPEPSEGGEKDTQTGSQTSSQPADAKTIAEGLVGRPVSELYAAIGQPIDKQYSPSCLDLDTDDGELLYDGFTVYTEGAPDDEVVYAVF